MIAADGTMNAGIFEYGNQWVRDTSNTALGAIRAGQFNVARAALVPMCEAMCVACPRSFIYQAGRLF